MIMDNLLLEKYAKLLVYTGVNLQKGQRLVINSPVECAYFARMINEEAYRAGAKDVIMDWNDGFCTRQHYLYADDSVFEQVSPWTSLMKNSLAEEGAAYIVIDAEDPEMLTGTDPGRLKKFSNARGRDLKTFYHLEMTNGFPWCIASIPIPSWAVKVFPDCSEEEAMNRLWDAILKTVHIDAEHDPVEEWKKHCSRLEGRAARMNEYHFRSLHYTNSLGTDLTIKMPEDHVWISGREKCKAGLPFIANMPTEEVFSAPLKYSAEGVVCASKPLVLNGSIVSGIKLRLEEGRIVEVHADTNEDMLKASIDTDDGSHYFGEIALVQYDSPISNSGILFYNTLFDENASCHFAYGEAYPGCIEGGDDMSLDELKDHGINAESDMHIDFMVGTPDLSIVGTTADGRQVEVFRNGNFTF